LANISLTIEAQSFSSFVGNVLIVVGVLEFIQQDSKLVYLFYYEGGGIPILTA
jgi:hypothetical protein